MAKPPAKAGETTASKTASAIATLPKAPPKTKTTAKGKAVPKTAKPAAEKSAAVKPVKIAKLAKVAKAKPRNTKAPSAKAEAKSLLAATSAKISQLASDILADRIVPTIDQIKAIAAHALNKDDKKAKKGKGKK
jgi:hypothetical protein